MKEVWLVLLALLAMDICAAQIPNLVGNWTGTATGYIGGDEPSILVENDSISLAIAEQNNRLFIGNITYMRNGTEIVDSFAGAIGLDNKTFYVTENKGYGFGTIFSDDDIEMIYLEDGEPGITAIDKFHRMK